MSEFLEKIEKAMEKEYGKDWKKNLLKKVEKETREDIKRQEEACRNFHTEQISFIRNYGNKKIEISQEFFDVSVEELKRSFQCGEEMGMLLVFRENEEKVIGDEFYDTNWMQNNRLGLSTPFRMSIRDEKTGKDIFYPLGCFGFHYEDIHEMMRNKNRLIVSFHTHPYKAEPSTTDMEIKPCCEGIIGFESVSEDLKKLTNDTFKAEKKYKYREARTEDFVKPDGMLEDEWKKTVEKFIRPRDDKQVREFIPFEIPDSYGKILEECRPTTRIFYTDDDKIVKIPLYLGNRKLN